MRVVERIEGRPVTRGQKLMEIADPGQRWELELYVPESKMGHIMERRTTILEKDPDAKLQLTFMLATHPDHDRPGPERVVGQQSWAPHLCLHPTDRLVWEPVDLQLGDDDADPDPRSAVVVRCDACRQALGVLPR